MSLIEDRPSGSADGPPRTARAEVTRVARVTSFRWPQALRELLLVATLWVAYSLGRQAADGHVTAAFANARGVWDLEKLLRLPAEGGLQDLLLQSSAVVTVANCYYAFVHFPATAMFLVWMYLRRPDRYRRVRNTLALLTAAALVVHTLFPLAPPRMLGVTGMIDTGRLYGPGVYGPPDTDTFTNQYAAMPSLHVGWAILVAVTLIAVTTGPWRWLWLAHPILTFTVVVGTANHYWVDGVVAGVMLYLAFQATGALAGTRRVLIAVRGTNRQPQE